MKGTVLLLFLAFSVCVTTAQPYVSGGKTRHRFAQLNLGADLHVYSAKNTKEYVVQNGELTPASLPNLVESKIVIGGTHFWGHADFFVVFSVANWGAGNYSTGVQTGAKYFPWRLEEQKIRPFIGASFSTQQYKNGDGTTLQSNRYPLLLGLNYLRGQHIFGVQCAYANQPNQFYYVDKATAVSIGLPQFSFGISYKFMLETTLSAEPDWQSGRTAKVTESLASQGKLSGITLGIGVSSAFFLAPSSLNSQIYPYLSQHKTAHVFPEFGIGYYFFQPDLQVNFAFRNISSTLSAYGHKQTAKRVAATLEVYKFLVDYHGFVPFAGLFVSYETLKLTNTIDNKTSQNMWFGLKPGLTFGWDIRPNSLQNFYLRTNVRWTPNLNVATQESTQFSFDQLEFNFIELVVFPERFFK